MAVRRSFSVLSVGYSWFVSLPKACQQRCGVVLVLDQVGRRAVVHTAVQRDNARCHAVYRAKLQLPGQRIPKPRGEAGTHFRVAATV